jgi:hypothetical protein
MKVETRKEHEWLQRLVGEWICEGEGWGEPGKPPMKWTGTETVRPLGAVWIVAEGRSEMAGEDPGITMMTLGFDPTRDRFIGTFAGSMMTHLWVYEGALDVTGTVLTLDTEGPTMDGGGMAKFKDAIEIKSDGHRVMTSHMLDKEGIWRQLMTLTYRRKR